MAVRCDRGQFRPAHHMIESSADAALGQTVRWVDKSVDVIRTWYWRCEWRHKEGGRGGARRNVVHGGSTSVAACKIHDEVDGVDISGFENPFGAQGKVQIPLIY